MCLLTDSDLNDLICKNKDWQDDQNSIHIFPYSDESLTPVGYDIRIGKYYASSLRQDLAELDENDEIIIRPGETVLITTEEEISMPRNHKYSGMILSKVSKVSLGLSHVSTTIDPDWSGRMLIAMHNLSHNKINLKYGEQFCTAIFFKNNSASTMSCNKPAGRSDLLMTRYLENARKTRKKENQKRNLMIIFQALIIVVFLIIGYKIFGEDKAGITAMAAAGVGMASLLKNYVI